MCISGNGYRFVTVGLVAILGGPLMAMYRQLMSERFPIKYVQYWPNVRAGNGSTFSGLVIELFVWSEPANGSFRLVLHRPDGSGLPVRGDKARVTDILGQKFDSYWVDGLSSRDVPEGSALELLLD